MFSSRKNSSLKLGTKLIVIQALAIIVVLSVLAMAAGQLIKSKFTEKSSREMADLNKRIIEMIDVYNLKLKEHAVSLADVLISYAAAEKKGKDISQDSIDKFTKITGAVATHFVRKGDDFLRVATSLRKQDGSRAIGTLLDRNHPGYKKVLSGEHYTGTAVLFGRNYMTHYEPIMADGMVTGIYFIGLDFTEGIKNLKNKIRSIKVAKTGYVFIVEGNNSAERGKAVVHISESLENKDISGLKDNDGKEFVKTMLNEKDGILKYNWTDENGSGIKFAVFNSYDEWNWIIAASAMQDELISEGIVLRNYIFIGFLFCSIIILIVLYAAVRKIITVRFSKLNSVVKNLAEGEGDLTVRLNADIRDEIGELSENFNKFLDDLENMISEIMHAGQNLTESVESISEGNQDLSQRTAEQSSSLEEIASTIEQALASLNLNAENAQRAKDMTGEGAVLAADGNNISGQAVDAIKQINESSKKIMVMLSAIHEITFQTNLLSLNAAVEAARAGEHGRGFAVVAGEVRSLAKRSATAAKQIETIIQDSISKIEHGTSMVNKTGSVLSEIADSAKRSAALMVEINVASNEQRQGMSQINEAVTTLDSMTQQNAALVEETASASEQMNLRAKELIGMLRRFKIRDNNTRSGNDTKIN